MPKRSGSTPAVAKATNRASGVRPSSRARRLSMTTTAAAPSLICDELPAVTVPLTWNAGFSLASASQRRVAARPFVNAIAAGDIAAGSG